MFATTTSPSPPRPRQASLPPPPEHSGWVVFSSLDQRTGLITRQAKLNGEPTRPPYAGDGFQNILELQNNPANRHVLLSVRTQRPCGSTSSIGVMFDSQRSSVFGTKVIRKAPVCTLEITDTQTFVLRAEDSDELVVSRGAATPILFNVAGLNWE